MSGRSKRSTEATIGIAEAAYDLSAADADWFPRVLAATVPLLDRGLGVTGLVGKQPDGGQPIIPEAMHVASGAQDFPSKLMRAMAELPRSSVMRQLRAGIGVLSEVTAEDPLFLDAWRRHIDYAADGIGLTAMDPNGRMIHMVAPTTNTIVLTDTERQRWRMLAAHLSAGLRLRGRLRRPSSASSQDTGLPFGAEAVFDAGSLSLADASGSAKAKDSVTAMREAAVRVDRARGRLRRDDPDEALSLWWALLRGKWSMVEWFDTDERRYVLAIPNPPSVKDPRGLTKRESQVVAFAVLGENHKMIAYRLGISRSTVTRTLRAAMRKFNVKTHAELVAKLRALRQALGHAVGPSASSGACNTE